MVSVALTSSTALPTAQDAEIVLGGLTGDERTLVERALHWAVGAYGEHMLADQQLMIDHALGQAAIIAQLKLDADTRCAALLFGVGTVSGDAGMERLALEFGPTVSTQIASLAKLHGLAGVTRDLMANRMDAARRAQAEVLRKMLLAMADDLRVVLLRLASQLQTLRYCARTESSDRVLVARETLDLYAPLANRLGIWQLKWELEDLSFRFLEPDVYKRIARMLDERRVERQTFIEQSILALKNELAGAGVLGEVAGRPKHIYSIFQKMRNKALDFSEVYDVRALRVIVPELRDCYTALGLVHNLWQPITKEFDDYISRPKGNNYRSLHTAVIGPDERALEIQIRTQEMHHHAEFGVAAHWRYKEGTRGGAYDEKIAWLRQLFAWKDDVSDAADWIEQLRSTQDTDPIYVLTPQGRVVELPANATPIDFAYHLHTEVGHRCRGAKVDGSIVPLNFALRTGQRVEVIAAKVGGPSRDWLNVGLGYLQSNRARSKVRQWFNNLELEETLAQGRAMVERAVQRAGATGTSLEDLAGRLNLARPEDLFVQMARGEINVRQLALALDPTAFDEGKSEDQVHAHEARAESGSGGVLVVGMDRLMTQLAKCCLPVPPDRIVGFVTRGRGVSIHRATCSNLGNLRRQMPERMVPAEWGSRPSGVFAVALEINADDRYGLLRDISEVFARERINVTSVNTHSRMQRARMAFTIEVASAAQLDKTLDQLREVKGVGDVVRL